LRALVNRPRWSARWQRQLGDWLIIAGQQLKARASRLEDQHLSSLPRPQQISS
jgi:hypothetical protein